MTENNGIGRRRFLGRSLVAGAAAGLPWLELLADGRAARAQPATPPKRLVIVSAGHSPQSVENEEPDWIPRAAGAYGTLPTLLAPFDAYRDRMTTVSGVDNVMRGEIEGDNHMVASFTVLTCNAHRDGVEGTSIVRAIDNSGGSLSLGPSIDYAIADGLGEVPLTLRIGVPEAASRRTFGVDGSYDPGEPNPSRAFDHLFGSITAPPATLTPRQQLAARRTDLLDAVRRSYASLAGRAGAADRIRMEAHADLVRQFQADLDRTTTIVCSDPARPTAAGVSEYEDWDGRQDDVIGATHNSLVATAFACQAVRVASIHYSNFSANTFSFLNGGTPMAFSSGWHETVHGHDGNDMRRIPMLWYHDMVVDLVRKLEAIPEGEGTVFDHTVVLFTTNLANLLHGQEDMPVILLHGANSGLVRGQHLDLGRSRRTMADLWVTLSSHMGVARDSFGWNHGDAGGRPFNSGPIEELFA